MIKYYKKMSKRVAIGYIISIIAFAAVFALSYAVLRNIDPLIVGTGNIVLVIGAFVLVGFMSYILCRTMKNAVISSEENISASDNLSTLLKSVISRLLLFAFMNFAISFVGGVAISFVVDSFTELRYDNFALFCTVVKIPLFLGFLVLLFLFEHYNGFGDAKTKSFNPHILLIALILSFTLMLPMTVSDHMYDNSDTGGNVSYGLTGGAGRSAGKVVYNAQTVLSSNVDLYRDNYQPIEDENFDGLWVVASVLLSTAIQISVAMSAYGMGGKKYAKKRKIP